MQVLTETDVDFMLGTYALDERRHRIISTIVNYELKDTGFVNFDEMYTRFSSPLVYFFIPLENCKVYFL